jgi:hypothetical protein
MGDLKESRILCKGLMYLFLPVIIFGSVSNFFPIVYSIFPAQQSRMCICSFFKHQIDGNREFLLNLSDSTFRNLTISNSVSFNIINWIGTLVLVWLVFRIRHTSDDTQLKVECVCIVSVWVVFTMLT